jgi:hypothetical protein
MNGAIFLDQIRYEVDSDQIESCVISSAGPFRDAREVQFCLSRLGVVCPNDEIAVVTSIWDAQDYFADSRSVLSVYHATGVVVHEVNAPVIIPYQGKVVGSVNAEDGAREFHLIKRRNIVTLYRDI